MSRFRVTDAPLDGVRLVERMRIADERGFFVRLFCAEELSVAGWDKPVVQVNHTRTNRRGTVRGLHFQFPPHSEKKLVTCLVGAVWDVVVDLRARSPSFLSWFGAELSAENGRALLIPEGCAHGFQTLYASRRRRNQRFRFAARNRVAATGHVSVGKRSRGERSEIRFPRN